MKRFGSAAWNGSLREGKGSVSTESHALENHPYTFFSRYGEKPGTNPEELLGAAHAACFTMSFVRLLGVANFVPEQVDSKSEVIIDKDGIRVVHGQNPKLVGKPYFDAVDVNGKECGKDVMQIAAAPGTGWVAYVFKDPISGKVLPKEVYIEKAGDYVYVAGVYTR